MSDTDAGQNAGNAGQLPQISFSTFILSLASSTLVQLGEVPNPETGSLTPNAELAKHGIDTLAMLRDKITNGLTPDESSMLDSIIYELKMKYATLRSSGGKGSEKIQNRPRRHYRLHRHGTGPPSRQPSAHGTDHGLLPHGVRKTPR